MVRFGDGGHGAAIIAVGFGVEEIVTVEGEILHLFMGFFQELLVFRAHHLYLLLVEMRNGKKEEEIRAGVMMFQLDERKIGKE